MIKKLLFITFLFIGIKIFATEYYVSINGNNSNDGLSEAKPWKTLSYAVKKVRPGDTVWIKAGNYGNENVVFTKNGTSNNPISFIGYKNEPGDVKELYYEYKKGREIDYNELPTFEGHDRKLNIGFKLYKRSHLIIKNIQIKDYRFPIDALSGANNLLFENVIVKNAGGSQSDGMGFRLTNYDNHHNVIKNSISINSSMTAYALCGDYNKVLGCKSFADEDDGVLKGGISMDYHVAISGSNNVVKRHYAVHVGDLTHTGHGIVLKGKGYKTENNIIEDCDIININGSIELRHRQVKNNRVTNIRIKAIDSRNSGGVHFRDGASYNIVEKVSIQGLKGKNGAFSFYDTVEDGGTKLAASNNVIKNVWIADTDLGIRIGSSSTSTKKHMIHDNIITNCTFYNVKTLIRFFSTAKGGNNIIQNSIINKTKKHYYKSVTPKGWLKRNNNYYDNEFDNPTNNGNISKSVNFVDKANRDFRLKKTSGCIDKGLETDLVNDDFLGTSRPQGDGIDIGAYEYEEVQLGQINAGEDKSICAGDSVELEVEGEGPFIWSTGETTKSITVDPTETMEYTVSNGSTTDSVIVNVNQLPVFNLGDDKLINKGDSVVINGPAGYSSYSWSTGGTTESITVSPQEQSIYKLTVTNENGCSHEESITINVKETQGVSSEQTEIKVSADQTICLGDVVELKASGGDSYLWSDGSTNNSIEVSPTVTTNYSLLVKKEGEIKTFNIIVYIGNDCVYSEKEMKLYPNPTSRFVNVDLKGYVVKGSEEELSMYLMTINGNVLKKETISSDYGNSIIERKFDLSSYSKGTYFFKVQSGAGVETKKLVLR